MNVVDSSAWIEFFVGGPNASFFAPPIENVERLIVPSICVLEVFKKVLRERGEDEALRSVAQMQQGKVVALDTPLALLAAKLGLEHKLPLADSVVLATAWTLGALVWTQDVDFEGLEGVRFKAKRK